jgi:hypothetical protein
VELPLLIPPKPVELRLDERFDAPVDGRVEAAPLPARFPALG